MYLPAALSRLLGLGCAVAVLTSAIPGVFPAAAQQHGPPWRTAVPPKPQRPAPPSVDVKVHVPHARIVFTRQPPGEPWSNEAAGLYLATYGSRRARLITDRSINPDLGDDARAPVFSSRGDKVAFFASARFFNPTLPRYRRQRLWVLDLHSHRARALTPAGWTLNRLVWSKDDRSIIVEASDADHPQALCVIDTVTGVSRFLPRPLLLSRAYESMAPGWDLAPDGLGVLFLASERNRTVVYEQPLRGGDARRLFSLSGAVAPDQVSEMSVAPDGKKIAVCSEYRTLIATLSGKTLGEAFSGMATLHWSWDGRYLAGEGGAEDQGTDGAPMVGFGTAWITLFDAAKRTFSRHLSVGTGPDHGGYMVWEWLPKRHVLVLTGYPADSGGSLWRIGAKEPHGDVFDGVYVGDFDLRFGR